MIYSVDWYSNGILLNMTIVHLLTCTVRRYGRLLHCKVRLRAADLLHDDGHEVGEGGDAASESFQRFAVPDHQLCILEACLEQLHSGSCHLSVQLPCSAHRRGETMSHNHCHHKALLLQRCHACADKTYTSSQMHTLELSSIKYCEEVNFIFVLLARSFIINQGSHR